RRTRVLRIRSNSQTMPTQTRLSRTRVATEATTGRIRAHTRSDFFMPGKGAHMGRPARSYPTQSRAACGERLRPRTEANVCCSKRWAEGARRNEPREELKAASADRDTALEFPKDSSSPEGEMGGWIWSGKLTGAGY